MIGRPRLRVSSFSRQKDPPMTRLISRLSEIPPAPQALLCDLWGVLHDGLRVFPAAAEALVSYRARGGKVLLLTNAPRPAPSVIAQLEALGAPREAYDGVVSSGDATRAELDSGRWGRRVVFIGAEKDEPLLEGLPLERVAPEAAESVLCAGFADDASETVADYVELLTRCRARNLPMLCANPDLLIHRGGREVPCAGALADWYAREGGEVVFTGKPHRPIYDLALKRLGEILGEAPDPARILAVGDGPATDVLGAAQAGIPALFVTGGIAVQETMRDGEIRPDLLEAFLKRHDLAPAFAMAHLA